MFGRLARRVVGATGRSTGFNSTRKLATKVFSEWHSQKKALFLGATTATLMAGAAVAYAEHNHNSTRKFPKTYALLESATEQIRAIVGESRLSLEESDRVSHGISDWNYHVAGIPHIVVQPMSTEEVSKIVQICNHYELPVIPYGGGTSLEGHFAAPDGGVCIDMGLMSNIVQIREADMDVTVQPGVKWEDLNYKLQSTGLFFPMDPGPGATIGGMVGTGCSGTNAVRYGTMRDWVLNLTVVLADGSIVKTAQRAKKSSAGYKLTNLFVGSEGTLGVVTEVTLKLAVIPEHTAIAICSFPTIKDAADAVAEVMRSGVQVGAVELLDEVMMHAINKNDGYSYPEKPTLFFKFAGSLNQTKEATATVGKIAKRHKGGDFLWATEKEQATKLWQARKGALWAAMALKPGKALWTTDVCVPVSKLPEYIAETKKDIEQTSIISPIVGHVGDGNFHLFLLFDKEDPKEVEETQWINSRMIERAIKMEGTCTGEHGV
eukprot:Colp12_sorted_trinity150504_noHs@32163